MLFKLPDFDTLYDALLRRDARFDGQAYVGVASTGIFCRLTCPARKPLRSNCQFFATPQECFDAGFRPCKRCHPVKPAAETDPVIGALMAALDAEPDRRWSEDDVVAMGFDSSTVRRTFRRQYGMTFLQMARARRLRDSYRALAKGHKVIDAQLEAGFDSPSAFRSAFVAMLGVAPSEMKSDSRLKADFFETPLGPMIALADDNALRKLEFPERKGLAEQLRKIHKAEGALGFGRTAIHDQTEDQLRQFFAGELEQFTVPLASDYGTAFQQQIWAALRAIPAGETRSYGELAADIGRPTATRAVANANAQNQIALIIPCHRVIGADGTLTGYAGGLWRKQKLIEIERQFR
ncbi:bifunctional transcriptional activator/DNA repair enzyme AdaA [Marivivens aquimaris]|uniref:bifunctional transcriptional activator/DNA repair enzyme AdaA n=1 Tax=Marivivens aquimaris TaxID=2774876 RepID=UPI001881EB1C|nr:trifunctional transcriptional activator/DNA repair protein Ada/methylated-DNA--[protein]-cysteine S-methyltransferase [Marivivens aquimaris]